jgi:tripartite-type tricarboxylate transporter receptor subunit TctC
LARRPGNGSLSHFLGISVNLAADLKMTHVPYKDSGVGLIDLASARLPMMITGLSPQVELHKAGKIRLLAVSGEQRSPLVPDVPTLKEAGLNLSSSTSTGLFGPPRMAPELVQRIHAALQPIFSNAATQEKLAQQGMVPWQRTGAQLAASLVDGAQALRSPWSRPAGWCRKPADGCRAVRAMRAAIPLPS